MNPPTAVDRSDQDETPVDVDYLLGRTEREGERQDRFRIGDLAREFGVSLRTLRFYEDRGLLTPERRGTTRIYSRRDRARLRLVLLGKVLGFSLTEAKQLIEIYDQPNGPRRQLEAARERFAEQREILADQQRELAESMRALDISIERVAELLNDKG